MSLSINSNSMSLNAQRNLERSNKTLATVFKRLSSGMRINQAKDDAAGLSVSTRMEAQIREHNQAIRNVNDGISMAQVAEGGMQESMNVLQRMRELAVQAANDTYTSGDRADMELEIDQLKLQLDSIASDTEFNGQKLLDGSFTGKKFALGSGSVDLDISQSHNSKLLLTNEFLIKAAADSDYYMIDHPTVTGLENGNYVIVWQEFKLITDPSDSKPLDDAFDIYGKLLDPSGNMIGNEFIINGAGTQELNFQEFPSVSSLKDGGFVVSWGDESAGGARPSEIYAKIYDDNAVSQGNKFKLSSEPATAREISSGSRIKSHPQVVGLDNGDFVASWRDGGYGGYDVDVFGRVLDKDGDQQSVDNFLNGQKTLVMPMDITATSNGEFIVAGIYSDLGSTVYMQNHNSTGGKVGNAIDLGIASYDFDIEKNGENEVVVTWKDMIDDNLYTQVFATNGTALSDKITISDSTTATTVHTSSSSGNGYTVIWQDDDSDGKGLFGQIIDQDFNKDGGKFSINSKTKNTQGDSVDDTFESLNNIISYSKDGSSFLVTWLSNETNGNADTFDFYGKIFGGVSLDDSTSAETSISIIDNAITNVSNSLSNIGSFQNRLESISNNLMNQAEDLTQARSRIMDADIAQETANLTTASIIQQAGIAILAQANQQPQIALQLLG